MGRSSLKGLCFFIAVVQRGPSPRLPACAIRRCATFDARHPAANLLISYAKDIFWHRFNTKFWKTRERKPEKEVVEMAVPPIVDKDEFEIVQMLLKSRSPAMVAPRVVSGPTPLTGICFCAGRGGAMTLRTGKSGRYRYHTCCTKARQGESGCPGRTVPMEKLDKPRSRVHPARPLRRSSTCDESRSRRQGCNKRWPK